MQIRSTLLLLAATLSTGLLSKAALADTLSITSPTVTTAGGTVAVYGTYTNTGTGLEYFNGDDFSINSPAIGVGTDYFFNNGPYDLAAGSSFTEELFSLTVNPGLAAGSDSAFFDVLGGPDTSTLNVLASTTFNVNVTNAAAAVTPEPSTWLLLGTGVLGMAFTLRRRQISATASPLA